MDGAEFSLPGKSGDIFVSIWLQIFFTTGLLLLWTNRFARILFVLHLRTSNSICILQKSETIDCNPVNGDIRQLPPFSKFMITLIRILMTLLLSIGTLGIEYRISYKEAQQTTHVVVANDFNFTGRPVCPEKTNSIPDYADSVCEEVDILSIKKVKAFIADSIFSCSSSQFVSDKEVIAEVMWDRRAIKQISQTEKRPANIKLGDQSKMSNKRSNNIDITLVDPSDESVVMFLNRRYLRDETFGDCKGEREYY